MAGIKAPLQDILTKLSTLTVSYGNLYARVWNNQLRSEQEGKIYDYPKPAAFVEFITPVSYQLLGGAFATSDVGVNIHLIHEFYNQDGTFEQDLAVFDLRDSIVALFSKYKPTGCGEMVFQSETQDYDHDNLYHYIVSFTVNFIDSKGSPYDPPRGNYVDSEPPTDLQIDVDIANQPISNPISQPYRIPQ